MVPDELKRTKICSSCGREIDIEDNYCECGRAQPTDEFEY